ncbi:MAG: DUF3349 domain-containing protein [Planctomycetia bacterium]|nr:DUF3349 domain-containing protein [Planctomycetia bacterium]
MILRIKSDIPAHLQPTCQMLMAAFPKGIPAAAYRPLLALLVEHMSLRAIAKVMELMAVKGYDAAYHDALGAANPRDDAQPTAEEIEQVRHMLLPHGFETWMASE